LAQTLFHQVDVLILRVKERQTHYPLALFVALFDWRSLDAR
jgi:hypothetical protein